MTVKYNRGLNKGLLIVFHRTRLQVSKIVIHTLRSSVGSQSKTYISIRYYILLCWVTLVFPFSMSSFFSRRTTCSSIEFIWALLRLCCVLVSKIDFRVSKVCSSSDISDACEEISKLLKVSYLRTFAFLRDFLFVMLKLYKQNLKQRFKIRRTNFWNRVRFTSK